VKLLLDNRALQTDLVRAGRGCFDRELLWKSRSWRFATNSISGKPELILLADDDVSHRGQIVLG
jgi:hypothetical protein